MQRMTGLLGVLTMLLLAYLFSTNRKAIRLKTVVWGLSLQIVIALLVLRLSFGRQAMEAAGNAINRLLSYSQAGSQFVFGALGIKGGSMGFYFAFQVLPTIIFVASFFAILYHLGIMQFVIRQLAWVMMKVMGASGAESMNVAASIFLGHTEAPLTIRPYLAKMTRSELMTVMTSGMAHVSGAIMAAYLAFGIEAKHILTAVIMTAPGTILIAKMLVPETEVPETAGRTRLDDGSRKETNLVGAIARGATDGLYLALNVAAMLIAFLALIALTDGIIGGIHNLIGWFPSSLESILGAIFAPIAWLIGVPAHDVRFVGNLLGTRLVLNEVIAFSQLGAQKALLDPRTFTIASFALCGFANFSSIGMLIGGIGSLAPDRRDDLARLGFRAMLAGTMANLISASIAGVLL